MKLSVWMCDMCGAESQTVPKGWVQMSVDAIPNEVPPALRHKLDLCERCKGPVMHIVLTAKGEAFLCK